MTNTRKKDVEKLGKHISYLENNTSSETSYVSNSIKDNSFELSKEEIMRVLQEGKPEELDLDELNDIFQKMTCQNDYCISFSPAGSGGFAFVWDLDPTNTRNTHKKPLCVKITDLYNPPVPYTKTSKGRKKGKILSPSDPDSSPNYVKATADLLQKIANKLVIEQQIGERISEYNTRQFKNLSSERREKNDDYLQIQCVPVFPEYSFIYKEDDRFISFLTMEKMTTLENYCLGLKTKKNSPINSEIPSNYDVARSFILDGIKTVDKLALQGIYHRDISQKNIYCKKVSVNGKEDYKFYFGDFGNGKIDAPYENEDPTKTVPLGTPPYKDPKSNDDGVQDIRSELYGVAKVALYILNNCVDPPNEVKNQKEFIKLINTLKISAKNDKEKALIEVIEKATDTNYSNRYSDPGEMERDLLIKEENGENTYRLNELNQLFADNSIENKKLKEEIEELRQKNENKDAQLLQEKQKKYVLERAVDELSQQKTRLEEKLYYSEVRVDELSQQKNRLEEKLHYSETRQSQTPPVPTSDKERGNIEENKTIKRVDFSLTAQILASIISLTIIIINYNNGDSFAFNAVNIISIIIAYLQYLLLIFQILIFQTDINIKESNMLNKTVIFGALLVLLSYINQYLLKSDVFESYIMAAYSIWIPMFEIFACIIPLWHYYNYTGDHREIGFIKGSIILIIFLLFPLTIIGFNLPNITTSINNIIKSYSSLSIGDELIIGSFEQDGHLDNGNEQISWTMQDIADGRALLLSDICIEAMPYNGEGQDNSWENSDIRSWLNDEFFVSAFSLEDAIFKEIVDGVPNKVQ